MLIQRTLGHLCLCPSGLQIPVITGVTASQPWGLGYFSGMVDVSIALRRKVTCRIFKLSFVTLENRDSGD